MMLTLEEIFPYILAPVIVFSIQYIITKIFEIKDRKRKKSIWIRFLRKTNRIINECLSTFEKLESTDKKWIEFFKPIILFLPYIAVIFLFIIILFFVRSVYISMAFSSFILSISVPLLVVILYQHTEKIKNGDLLNKSNKINDYYTIICWLFFGICALIIPFIYGTFFISNQIPISDLEMIRFLYFISIIMIIYTMVILFISFRRLFFGRLKSEINKLYSRDFPIVNISTSVEMLNGKICYIFDEDLIILDDDGLMKGIQWDDIIFISDHKDNN